MDLKNIVARFLHLFKDANALLKRNPDIINSYNFTVLRILSGVTCAFLCYLLIDAYSLYLPVVTPRYQAFYTFYTALAFVGLIVPLVIPKLAKRYSWAFLYFIFSVLMSFSLRLNLMLSEHRMIPYTITLGFLIIFPSLIIDNSIRISAFTIISSAAAIIMAIRHKEEVYVTIDTLDILAFCVAGILLGIFSKMFLINYLNIKERAIDKNIEVLRAKTEAKSLFLANMSHELRTPIHVVLGMDEMILRETSDPNLLTYANNIKVAADSLYALVNDILDFSKIEANKMDLVPVPYHLDSLLNDIITMITQRAQNKGLQFDVNIDEDLPIGLYGDDVRIKQCILNLLTNAVKYTETGTVTLEVTFRLIEQDVIELHVLVRDTGIGIKEEDRQRMFLPFERVDEEQNAHIEGCGLGLSIVQRVLHKMESHLEVQSTVGKGSEFSFTIVQDVLQPEPIGNLEERIRQAQTKTSTHRDAFIAPRARILVIDDLKLNIDVLRGLLKKTQITIDSALSGRQALQMVQDIHYDIIFIDHRMPGMDGLQTLAAMKELPGNPVRDTPCIALTANAMSGSRELYMRSGFADYLSKPVDYRKLDTVLQTYLPDSLIVPQTAEHTATPDAHTLSESRFFTAFQQVDGVDTMLALQYCGDIDVLKVAVQDYYKTIESKSEQIAQYAAQDDFENYTILVHALKSASRLVGIGKLYEDALYLEECGEKQNGREIKEKTPALLKLYRSYREKFAPLIPETNT